jgi:hypothetical protein
MSDNSDKPLAGDIVSRDDSATLLALDNALLMLDSWSSSMKSRVGTTALLELSLASSSVTSLRPCKIWRYSRPLKLFSSLWSS